MRWGFPYTFLLLLGAVPLILWLHSLRPKGLKVKTTALFLLEPLLRERAVGKKLGWLLKKNLLLILQLLAALVLIAALADPSLLRFGASSGDTVVVMDLSASMKAKGRSGSRFDAARRELFSLINDIHSDGKMMVLGAGPTPQVLSPFTSDKGKLKELARNLQPTDAPAQVKEAILFAHSFLKRGSQDKVVVFSDGAFAGAEEIPWHSQHLRWVRVEGGSKNVGITGFEFRRLPDSPNQYEIMIAIKNFTPDPIRTPLTVAIGEKRWVEEKLELAPQERRVLIYPYRGPLQGKATALLGIDDDFSTDNRAFLVLSESPVVRLLYAGKGNPFLEQLFRSFPYVQVTRVDPSTPDFLSSHLPQSDLVVLDGVPSPPVREGNFILINTAPKGFPMEVRGKVLGPKPLPLAQRHPLTEGVRLDDLYIKESLHLIPKGEEVVLARSKETPLIFAYEKGRLRALIIGFDLLASDLPFKVAFPVLFSNALEWFHPQRAEFPSAQVQAGAPYLLHLKGTDDQVEVRGPSGRRQNFRVTSNPLPFVDTVEAGFYTFKSKSGAGQFAVNLLSEAESTIVPSSALRSGQAQGENKANGEKLEAALSLWPFLLAVVFALLVVEGLLAFRAGGSFYPFVVRLIALAGVILALINPRIFKATDALDVVLGVDFSHSVGQAAKDKALQILEESRRLQGSRSRTGLLFFGSEAAWEFFPRADFPVSDFLPSVGRGETNIEAALQAGIAQMGEGRQGRILLLSDGNENRGQASRVLPLLRSQGAQVWPLPVNLPEGKNEIYVRELLLPHQVDSAETFEVKGAVESLYDAPAQIKLLRDGVIQREKETTVRAGTNWFGFTESLRERGSHTFDLLVESSHDTIPENNLLQGVVQVKGPPRVLYLHATANSQRFLSRVLSAQGYSVTESAPEKASLTLAELSDFDLLVLDNVPAYRLTQAKMEAIEKYVRDLGGGLIVIGGPQSYGAGGYHGTPLDRVLPVEMRPPGRLDLPQVALLFVLDKSGSMGGGPQGASKLDLAKAAAMAAADLLNPSDQVGILAFDAGWDWLLPFRPVGKGEWISERLSSVQSDGGTDLYKAMVEAHRSFSAKEAAVKHLLILSDGLTDKADFSSLVQKMAREGITVATVSVGEDADVALMAGIARNGKGRAYVTVDPTTIPQIFTTETLLISRDLLVEKLVEPKVAQAVGPLKGFSQIRIPSLRGYVLTHPKARADLLMKVDEDPLLASWRYGLGRVLAFTSDLSGRWGRNWVGWTEFPQWAGQLARSAMKRVSENRVRTEFHREGEEVKAVVDFLSRKGSFINHLNLKGILTAPDQASLAGAFQQMAPGRYEARFSGVQRGVHLLTIYEEGKKGEEPLIAATVPFVSPYPEEYREVKPNIPLLTRIAEETGGEVLDSDQLQDGLKRLFTPDPGKATAAKETWRHFSGLVLFFFLADLALRRWPGKFPGAG